MTQGIAGFINGVFDGMDWQEARQTRKREREMRDERHGWARNEEGRVEDRHGWAGDEQGRIAERQGWARQNQDHTNWSNGRTRRETDRLDNFAADERQAYADAFAASQEEPEPRAEQAAPIVEAEEEAPVPEQRRGRERGVLPTPSTPLSFGDGKATPAPEEAPSYSYEDWQGMNRAERQRAGLPVSLIGGQLGFNRLSVGMGGEPTRLQEGGERAPGALERAEGNIRGQARAALGLPSQSEQSAPLNLGMAQQEGRDPNAPSMGVSGALTTPATVDMPKGAEERGSGGLTFGTSAQGQAVAQTAEGAPAPSVTMATQAAAPAARRSAGVSGDGMPVRLTTTQQDRGTKSFMDNYMKTGAPKMVEFYMQRGEVEKAQAFQSFIEEADTKAAMRSWSLAVQSAAVGDDHGFARNVEATYNASGYFDDGMSIVPGSTTLTRDASGKVNGGAMTFRNNETGEEFVHELESREDLLELGIGILSPEAVFERGMAEVDAARATRQTLAVTRAQGEVDAAAEAPETLRKMVDTLATASTTYATLPLDEQIAVAQGVIADPTGSKSGGGVPYLADPALIEQLSGTNPNFARLSREDKAEIVATIQQSAN